MNAPENLRYTQTHEWIAFTQDGKAKIGITDYAQQVLGDVVYVSLPHSGEEYKKGDIFADVESVKTEAEIYMPMDGKILTANMALVEQPQRVNEDAYGSWLVEVRGLKDEGLLGAAEYEKFVEALSTNG
ncbi:MAG: glycine cleavage system protein GcvH [Christensenella sp.]|uniref:glycine cleavage system protein GcvH n=1 Tax=Christensenella sp. TaxID=1935934 RepID=UPI002B1EDBD7|nr:glycine cleavage system protein GcvH [Christensenella sp.]MEA5004272.1 glycine cleavage system protein GcvH [Christensenella sp.]